MSTPANNASRSWPRTILAWAEALFELPSVLVAALFVLLIAIVPFLMAAPLWRAGYPVAAVALPLLHSAAGVVLARWYRAGTIRVWPAFALFLESGIVLGLLAEFLLP